MQRCQAVVATTTILGDNLTLSAPTHGVPAGHWTNLQLPDDDSVIFTTTRQHHPVGTPLDVPYFIRVIGQNVGCHGRKLSTGAFVVDV